MVSKVDSLSGRQAETAAASAAGPSSILLNLLNHPRHQRFTAGSSSASQHAATFSPSTAKSLCVIHDSLLQSNVPLLREIITRCAFRSEPSLVICAERRPEIFTHAIPPDFARSSEVASLMTYPPSQDGLDEDQLFAKISGDLAAARAVAPKAPITVILDSCEPIVNDLNFGAAGALSLIRRLFHALPDGARLIVGAPSDTLSDEVETLVSSLQSSLFWSQVASSSSASGAFTSISLQPADILDFLATEYALNCPATPKTVRRAIEASEGEDAQATDCDREYDSGVDSRFWPMIEVLLKRGPLGSQISSGGWWTQTPRERRCRMDSLGTVESIPQKNRTSQRGATAVLFARQRHRNGKFDQEVLACEIRDGRLRLLPIRPQTEATPQQRDVLQTLPNVQKATGVVPSQESHQNLVASLPFNLKETSAQRSRRGNVSLPYLPSTSVPGQIIFHPESDDDPDEEEDGDDEV